MVLQRRQQHTFDAVIAPARRASSYCLMTVFLLSSSLRVERTIVSTSLSSLIVACSSASSSICFLTSFVGREFIIRMTTDILEIEDENLKSLTTGGASIT
jgi:hypothetical protein